MRQPTADQAAWIRAHAWTPAMRKEHREVPGHTDTCACQWGPTSHCLHGRHDRCHRATSQRVWATVICGPDGVHPLSFAEPYEHETDTFATGRRPTTLALVWHADRVCRWACSCTCHDALFTLAEVA